MTTKNNRIIFSSEITIPKFYDHSNWIESFIRRNKICRYCNTVYVDLKKSDFVNAQHKIKSGQKYKIEILRFEDKKISNNEQRNFVKSHEGLAVGGHALLLLKFLKLDFFDHAGFQLVSFNELSDMSDDIGVPMISWSHPWQITYSPSSGSRTHIRVLLIMKEV